MEKAAASGAKSVWSRIGTAGLGGSIGGLVGGFFVVGVTLVLKAGTDFVASLDTWLLIALPLLGVCLAVLVLHGYGRSEDTSAAAPPHDGRRRSHPFRTFPQGAVRADITTDIVDSAGEEERFPWRLAPIRGLAILATVGTGAAMGTEAPAAYLGVASGACLGDRGQRWRRLARSAALGGGAAGVAALMGVALIGTAYILELGWRRRIPFSAERVTATFVGGLVGRGIDAAFDLYLLRLIVPREPPRSFLHAAIIALFIGAAAGAISALAAVAFKHAKKWKAKPAVRLVLGGSAALATTLLLATLVSPATAVGPGGAAILWAEATQALPSTLLAVCLLRAAATTAVIAAGGCGGVFVPFLAVGDIGGRVFALMLGVGTDLAGAAGAAAGIAGGYRLPLTATAMMLSVGGPYLATLTCLATVVVAWIASIAVEIALERTTRPPLLGREAEAT